MTLDDGEIFLTGYSVKSFNNSKKAIDLKAI